MKLIIDGADGAGKSTLAKMLGEKLNLDVVHMRGKDSMRFPFLYHTLDKLDVIWDRHFLSERIYSEFYDLPYRITKGQEKVLHQKCKDNDVKIIICNPVKHNVTDDEDEDIVERHDEIVKAYEELIEEYDLISVDPFTMSLDEIIDLIS